MAQSGFGDDSAVTGARCEYTFGRRDEMMGRSGAGFVVSGLGRDRVGFSNDGTTRMIAINRGGTLGQCPHTDRPGSNDRLSRRNKVEKKLTK